VNVKKAKCVQYNQLSNIKLKNEKNDNTVRKELQTSRSIYAEKAKRTQQFTSQTEEAKVELKQSQLDNVLKQIKYAFINTCKSMYRSSVLNDKKIIQCVKRKKLVIIRQLRFA